MTTARSFSLALLRPFRAVAARYGRVLALPGAAGFVVPAAVARLGVAMTGLGLLFSMHAASGSYAVAGAATAVFAAAESIVGPQVARGVDRWGQTATVPLLVAVHTVAVALALTSAGVVPTPVMLVVVAIAGATVPQPGALSAARWVRLITEPTELRSAFSLEAGVNDVVFLLGPVLATLVSGSIAPSAGSVAAVLLLATGCLALSAHRRTAPVPIPPLRRNGPSPRARRTSLLTPRFVATLGVNLGLGGFFGAVPLLTTAAAASEGLPALTGLVLASSSAASILAGLTYGSLRATPSPRVVQVVAATVLTAAVAIGAAWPSLPGLAVTLVLGGTAIAPLLASSSQIVQATVATEEVTQGFTWINTASAAGIAASAALTGTLLAAGSIRLATLALIGIVSIAVVSAAWSLRVVPDGRERPGCPDE